MLDLKIVFNCFCQVLLVLPKTLAYAHYFLAASVFLSEISSCFLFCSKTGVLFFPICLVTASLQGGFGFNVRRAQFPDIRGHLRVVVFAEPTEVRYGPPRPSEIRTSLLPGDQLIMVNGRSVESIGREELLSLIQVFFDFGF